VIVLAVGALASGCETPCDPSYPGVDLEAPGGQESITSYELSGACRGSGTRADCRAFVVCSAGGTCPCRISLLAKDPTSSETVCHIKVVSAEGSEFAVDVATADNSLDGCLSWGLVDPSQSNIEVQFPAAGT
jgi:hypothetical protein